MSGWRALLRRMVADPDPRSYTYEDAARVLTNLGFELARPHSGGSHRPWRLAVNDASGHRAVYVGLVQKGHGTLKPVYIKQMLAILRAEGLLPGEE